MSTDQLTAEEAAIVAPPAPETPAPAATEAAKPAETPQTTAEPAKPAAETPPPAPETPKPEPRGGPNALFAKIRDLERKLAAFEQARPVEAPKKPEIPAFEADPASHLKAVTDEIRQDLERRRAIETQQSQIQQLSDQYRAGVAEFSGTVPDFGDAYAYLVNGRAAELAALGYRGPELQQALHREELAIANIAFQRGQNPGEVIYNVAKARGYAKAAPAPAKPDPAAQVARMATAQSQAASPTAGLGGTPAPELTLETISRMSDAELAALSPAQWQKANGG